MPEKTACRSGANIQATDAGGPQGGEERSAIRCALTPTLARERGREIFVVRGGCVCHDTPFGLPAVTEASLMFRHVAGN